jgi:hypothetical protein
MGVAFGAAFGVAVGLVMQRRSNKDHGHSA